MKRKVLVGLAFAIFALLISQMGFYTVQPLRAIPDGVTLVVWRSIGTPFFNSPDGMCLSRLGHVSILCRAVALETAPVDHIILRLPYMKWAYLMSTNGREY